MLSLRPANITDRRNQPAQQATLARLSQEVQRLEAAGRSLSSSAAISTGCLAMDACLPASGYLPGSVIEYLRATSGCGATYLALVAAAAALRATEEKYLVIVDTHRHLYPPALLGHQISLPRVIWVRPQSVADAVWATDQALRTTAVAAVVADLDALNERDARRLQLAAERGGGLGLLLRSLSARRMPSWAEVQWVVRSLVPMSSFQSEPAREPLRRLEVGLARVRGGKAGAQLLLDIDRARGTLELAARQGNHHEKISASAIHSPARPSKQLAGTADQESTVRMAAQLANSTNSSRRASAG
jgi:protein ImuA